MVRLTTYRISLRANARTLVTDKTLKRSYLLEKLDFHDATNYRHFIAFKRHLASSRRCAQMHEKRTVENSDLYKERAVHTTVSYLSMNM